VTGEVAASMSSVEPSKEQHVTLSGDRDGAYVVEKAYDDGALLLRPDTSAAAMSEREGLEPLAPGEFDELRRHMLPPDDEG
jgi:hypothetical protein